MRILVVDDDPEVVTLLARFLGKHGFEVATAADPLQALELLDQQPVGFVIADLMMPHMDGLTFVDKLKADPRFKELPVVLLTAWPSDEVFDKGLRKGAAFALPKPVDLDRLLTLVQFAQ